MKWLIRLIIAGVIPAFALGAFLKIVEQITGKAVYVLLLNVDYFPIVQDWEMSETLEFLLHVFVSVILVIILYFGFGRLGIYRKVYPYILASLTIGGVLFLTTVFSEWTPDVRDVSAFIYWMIGHLIYGALVGCILLYLDDKKDR